MDRRNLLLERKVNHRSEEYKYFVGSTLKNPIAYTAREKIVFKIRPKFMDGFLDVRFVRYRLEVEHGQRREGISECSSDGWFYIETSLSECGFAYLTAEACDENKKPIGDIEPFHGGAGADVHLIKRATKMPEDYMEFWASLKKAVYEAEPRVLFSEEVNDPRYPDFVILDMRISAEGGDYASVSVAYPRNSRAGELKFAMFFQGYGVGPATPHPMPGYFTVHVGAHALPNGCPSEYYSELYRGALRDYGYDPYQNKRPETTYFAGMLSRDLAAFRFFEENELLNKKDYFFVGSSQGGMQACNLAAHTDRATALILNVPWLSDVNGHELADRLENGMPKGEGIPYFDTAVAAELVRCPVYMISGLGDLVCNASSQMALFNSIRSRKYIEFYQNKTHSLTVPWDNLAYSLGDPTMKELYREHTARYYDFN